MWIGRGVLLNLSQLLGEFAQALDFRVVAHVTVGKNMAVAVPLHGGVTVLFVRAGFPGERFLLQPDELSQHLFAGPVKVFEDVEMFGLGFHGVTRFVQQQRLQGRHTARGR